MVDDRVAVQGRLAFVGVTSSSDVRQARSCVSPVRQTGEFGLVVWRVASGSRIVAVWASLVLCWCCHSRHAGSRRLRACAIRCARDELMPREFSAIGKGEPRWLLGTGRSFPESSLADDVARLRQVLALLDGPTNVIGLVYIAGFGLDQGESIGALLQAAPRPHHSPISRSTAGALPGSRKMISSPTSPRISIPSKRRSCSPFSRRSQHRHSKT